MRSSHELEASYFQAFLHARPDLQLEFIKHQDRPDFLAYCGSARIGVEVTRFSPENQPGLPRPEEQESLQQWTMELARSIYQRQGGAPMDVKVSFSSDRRIDKRRAPELAAELASFILGNTRAFLVYQHSDFDDILGCSFLPELEALSAFRVPTEGDGAWSANNFGWRRHAGESDVRRVLEGKKEKRIKSYRESCDELWLLIVFDGPYGDIHDDLPVEPVAFTMSTGFDRIFCLSPAGPRCVEVPVRPPETTE
ncbi:MAG TPA: hypothetical protein VE871_09150 [Longimicrobium sp.]|nr:hypothetical protein [Longimicrobium sp.]